MKLKILGFFVAWLLVLTPFAYADVITLRNGDRITGKIIETNEKQVTLETETMGIVTIFREHIQTESPPPAVTVPKIESEWQGKISAGTNLRQGNTHASSLYAKTDLKRTFGKNEITIISDAYYSSSAHKMNSQKYLASIRDDYDFGQHNQWYGFGKFEADRDRFANVAHRLTPSLGAGYAFWDSEEFVLKTELGAGFTHTNFRDSTKSRTEAILAPRLYLKRRFENNVQVSEDFIIYPSLSELGEYRYRSESILDTPLRDKIAFRLSFIVDYNANPGLDAEKTDTRLLSSIVYTL